MDYLVLLEASPNSWGAYVPDLPGCVAAAETKEEALALIREAVPLHVRSLAEHGDPVPAPTVVAVHVSV